MDGKELRDSFAAATEGPRLSRIYWVDSAF